MNDPKLFDQVQSLADQINGLAMKHARAIEVLHSYRVASTRLAHAIDLKNDKAADIIRVEVKKLRQEYFDITTELLFDKTI